MPKSRGFSAKSTGTIDFLYPNWGISYENDSIAP